MSAYVTEERTYSRASVDRLLHAADAYRVARLAYVAPATGRGPHPSVLASDLDRAKDRLVNATINLEEVCSMCHGQGTVNFEQASGWDEPCPKCRPGAQP